MSLSHRFTAQFSSVPIPECDRVLLPDNLVPIAVLLSCVLALDEPHKAVLHAPATVGRTHAAIEPGCVGGVVDELALTASVGGVDGLLAGVVGIVDFPIGGAYAVGAVIAADAVTPVLPLDVVIARDVRHHVVANRDAPGVNLASGPLLRLLRTPPGPLSVLRRKSGERDQSEDHEESEAARQNPLSHTLRYLLLKSAGKMLKRCLTGQGYSDKIGTTNRRRGAGEG